MQAAERVRTDQKVIALARMAHGQYCTQKLLFYSLFRRMTGLYHKRLKAGSQAIKPFEVLAFPPYDESLDELPRFPLAVPFLGRNFRFRGRCCCLSRGSVMFTRFFGKEKDDIHYQCSPRRDNISTNRAICDSQRPSLSENHH